MYRSTLKRIRSLTVSVLLLLGFISGLQAQNRQPSILKAVKPTYPASLIETGEDGEAVLMITIGKNGKVSNCELVSATRPEFGEAAIEAVNQWTFNPAMKDGKTISRKVKLPVRFAAPKAEAPAPPVLTPEQRAAMRIKKYQEEVNKATKRQVFFDDLPENPIDGRELERNQRPRPSRRPPFIYPPNMVGSGIEGVVQMIIVITPEGKVVNPEVVQTPDERFTLAALFRAAQMEFEAVKIKGEKKYIRVPWRMPFTEQPQQPQGRGGRGGGGRGGF